MQINSANSSQAVSSPNPDENPNQSLSVSRVTAVANSAEAITTASTSCAAQSSQEPAVSQTSSMTELGLTPDELDNLLDLNMTIDDNFDFDFDFDILDTEETETAPSGANLPNTASLAPVQEEPTEPSQSESTQDEITNEDERPSTSAAPPQNVALTNTETSFPTLAQLLTTSPLNYSAELAASDRQFAVASASQMRVDRGTARARRRDANAPIPRRREVLTRIEQEQIVDYSFRHCSGFSLQAAVDFMNSRPAEAFSGILTSSGAPYTFMPRSTYQEILRRIKGSMTHIP